MKLKLYEVAGEDEQFRPSPYCWRIRMALKHKGLEFESIPWRAVEKQTIAKSNGEKVPVLVNGDLWIRESWDIAIYLEQTFRNLPALLSSEGDQTKSQFIDAWMTQMVHPLIFRIVVQDQFPLLAEKDKAYYLARTRKKFGKSLNEIGDDPQTAITELNSILNPLQTVLARNKYLGGNQPNYGDYIVFGGFQWARVASERRIIAEDSPLDCWFLRLLDAFDGFASQQPSRIHWS